MCFVIAATALPVRQVGHLGWAVAGKENFARFACRFVPPPLCGGVDSIATQAQAAIGLEACRLGTRGGGMMCVSAKKLNVAR
jgi:hypothetical protein